MRRQNRSCDQCRKAKRGCDAPSLRNNLPPETATVDGEPADEESLPCSYCVRTNKRCTLNWARTHQQVNATAVIGRPTEHRRKRPRTHDSEVHIGAFRLVVDPSAVSAATAAPPPPVLESKGLETDRPATVVEAAVGSAVDSGTAFGLPSVSTVSQLPGTVPFWEATLPDLTATSADMLQGFDAVNFAGGLGDLSGMGSMGGMGGMGNMGNMGGGMGDINVSDLSNPGSAPGSGMLLPMVYGTTAFASMSPASLAMAHQPHFDALTPWPSVSTADHGFLDASSRVRPSMSIVTSPPSMVEQLLTTRTDNRAISANLLQIYHDVLEHNFACWVTEATCPYKGWKRPAAIAAPSAQRAVADMNRGPQWSNRIYQRVRQLDLKAEAAGLIHITPTQSAACQRALQYVIMAFATQWAQGSRHRDTYQANFAEADAVPPDEFDRRLQRTVWLEARRSLQECAHIESYRMVCAELIFGLVQRPWEADDVAVATATGASTQPSVPLSPPMVPSEFATPPGPVPTPAQAAAASRGTMLSSLEGLLARDGPPIFTERAARKMHNLKYRFDCHEAGQSRKQRHQRGWAAAYDASAASAMLPEDADTVRLLFWLAVMIDTIQASVYRRPVVLADEDSQHDAAADDDDDEYVPLEALSSHSSPSPMTADVLAATGVMTYNRRNSLASTGGSSSSSSGGAGGGSGSQRWRIDLFMQDGAVRTSAVQPPPPPPPPQWPCSYEQASLTIVRSAPGKVLLYRYVHYMQKMLRSASGCRRRAGGSQESARSRAARAAVEDTVYETLLVYRHWTATYGAFYHNLFQQYASAPPGLRGWSVCIASHWHLAALMLADVLEEVDARGCGVESARAARHAARTVAGIRQSSATQLSDIAQAATPCGFADVVGLGGWAPRPSPDLHFAVRQGTILTEPWSMLLIQAFSRAAVLHLRAHDARQIRQMSQATQAQAHGRQPQPGQQRVDGAPPRDGLQQCEDCVQALWLLGKRSDMARSVATVLSRAMHV